MSGGSNSKKVLLMGRAGAGKTSMRSIIFANYLARDTKRLTATNQVEHSHLRFLGNLVLSLWDCGGQDIFMENYFESQREHIFRGAEVLIYVLGVSLGTVVGDTRVAAISLKESEKDLAYFKNTMESIKQFSPHARVFVLVHKLDLIKESDRDKTLNTYSKECTLLSDGLNIKVFGTSIWDETLFRAWSDIVYTLIPQVDLLESNLRHFCDTCEADEVVLFEKSTFLVISHATRTEHKDPHRFEKISNIAKQFKLTCGKTQANFESVIVEHRTFTAVIEKFTHNTYLLMINSDKQVPSAATLANIDAARIQFEKISTSMHQGPTL
eukprot:GHVR01006266.1.p1 GENE.GHVR01006266.1~~GHVR01006266.1.p1  ORF type:complete len:325 (+),score=61.92 GHVR01006266.1:11-985(+)